MKDSTFEKKEKKLDRRAVRTRRALRNALIDLILEKGYDAITVQDITDRADLNRGTLYLHYRDKLDLLLNSSTEIYEELAAQLTPISPDNLTMDIPERHLLLIYQHVAANADMYHVLLGDYGVPAFVARLRHIIAQVSLARLEAIRALGVPVTPLPAAFVVDYYSGAVIGAIEWWLENQMPIPPEDLARYTLQLTVNGLYPKE